MAIDLAVIHQQTLNGGYSRSSRDRVCVVGAGQQDSFRRLRIHEEVHQCLFPAEYRDGITIAHSLSKHHQVRRHTRDLRITTNAMTEPSLNLIKDKDELETIG